MKVSASRVLLIEDDQKMQEVLSVLLLEDHIILDNATNAADVRALLERQPYDLILLDLLLPDLDGFGVCEILRRDPLTATIPIVIVSAARTPIAGLLGDFRRSG